ncbi:MAG TPA: cyanophycinase [Candidatus Thermoplasmatota archaeon]|nr:cyanophycinase [Candidatus Thermoplasmatota archaeon]
MPAEPKGCLLAVGGNEDKRSDKEVLRRLVGLAKGGLQHIEVIPTASRIPREVAGDYISAFRSLGVREVGVLDVRSRDEADRREWVERVQNAQAVFMTGGDQMRLATTLLGTKMHQAIVERYRSGGIVAGTSAGAAAMSANMIAGGDEGAMRKSSVRLAPGLGLIEGCVIDTHFLDRGRIGRLLEVVASNPGHAGLGVGEDTAILVREGHMVEVVGSGVVVVMDGNRIRSTNTATAPPGYPIAVEGVLVHTLAPGYRYDLRTHTYLGPSEPLLRPPVM